MNTCVLSTLMASLCGLQAAPPSKVEPKAPEGIQQVLDIPYARASEKQKLDIFAPKDAKNAPVILFVHGGTWMFGDKNFRGRYRPACQYLARQGVVMVAINYRLSPKVKHPEHVKDVARAYAWVRGHIRVYGGDRDRIVLCGHSAGGHLVALFAMADAYWKDESLGLTAKDRLALRGVIAACGVYRIPGQEEFAAMAKEMLGDRLKNREGRSRVPAMFVPILLHAGQKSNPFRVVFGSDAKVCKEASPLTHVRKGLPPFLLFTAEHDLPLLPEMAREFQQALKKADVPVELHKIDGSTHHNVLFRLNQAEYPVTRELLRFVDRCVGLPARKKP